ncbi:hypothetical protein [Psychromonas sp. SP041]|uniref:maleate cis-trans isomerase family protein n=1 Tax=Psychromonas sp. SP041 TaxID=1365007 RepID=UPI0010C7B586|nr:hypothetical protein [Psychromonas sp. SP041]
MNNISPYESNKKNSNTKLSNKVIKPNFSKQGVYLNGSLIQDFGGIDRNKHHKDPLHLHTKFSLIVPATNTTMEKEICNILVNNNETKSLREIGFHTSNVVTPNPDIQNKEDLERYKEAFLSGLQESVNTALLSDPEHIILGMSLEHILYGIDEVTSPIKKMVSETDLGWTTCHDAINSALGKYNAKKIGIITPFEDKGNASAKKMFKDLGYDVLVDVGLACGNTQHIAHIPDQLKESSILELLSAKERGLDAIVQCGTNMSFIHIAERLEPMIGIPILSINAVVLWHALRTKGITDKLKKSSRIFRDH